MKGRKHNVWNRGTWAQIFICMCWRGWFERKAQIGETLEVRNLQEKNQTGLKQCGLLDSLRKQKKVVFLQKPRRAWCLRSISLGVAYTSTKEACQLQYEIWNLWESDFFRLTHPCIPAPTTITNEWMNGRVETREIREGVLISSIIQGIWVSRPGQLTYGLRWEDHWIQLWYFWVNAGVLRWPW